MVNDHLLYNASQGGTHHIHIHQYTLQLKEKKPLEHLHSSTDTRRGARIETDPTLTDKENGAETK